MPDESCRECGYELTEFSFCAECRQPIRHVCRQCGIITIEKFHSRCFDYAYMSIHPLTISEA